MSCLCPPWESCGGTKAPPFFSFPLHSLFFQDEWIFQKLRPIVSYNRLRLSQFYAAFLVRGGSLSVGIEDCCDAVKTMRGCRSNTVALGERDEERKRKLKHTHSIQTPNPPPHSKQDGVRFEKLAKERTQDSLLNQYCLLPRQPPHTAFRVPLIRDFLGPLCRYAISAYVVLNAISPYSQTPIASI